VGGRSKGYGGKFEGGTRLLIPAIALSNSDREQPLVTTNGIRNKDKGIIFRSKEYKAKSTVCGHSRMT
jgi:hypothetical protein